MFAYDVLLNCVLRVLFVFLRLFCTFDDLVFHVACIPNTLD